MSRTPLTLSVLWIIACSDRSDDGTMAPNQPASRPSSDAPGNNNVDEDAIAAAHTALSGGMITVFDASPTAFSHAAPNLQGPRLARHEEGDTEFAAVFVPGAAPAHGGLGPTFDNVACESCHNADGRGRPPVGGEPFASMLFRASVAGSGPHGGPNPIPGVGGQLQLHAISGIVAKGTAHISYSDSSGSFADGTTFTLHVPHNSISGLLSPLPANPLLSPRVAPVVFGLGLLAAVPEEAVVGRTRAEKRHDGISGRPNYVWDEVNHRTALGRFGWKASVPSLVQQVAGAYNGDMGVTSALFAAENCEGAHPQCARHGPEIGDPAIEKVAFYTGTLAVPARRHLDDPKAVDGERLFHASGCAGCHVATLHTGVLSGLPEVSNQEIHPYTDLLVHDMGPALADDRPDFQASGRQWRTPPLWGIGLVKTVNGENTNFLHDGRARTLLEAVLWHGGEATAARERIQRLSAADRAALVAFLESL